MKIYICTRHINMVDVLGFRSTVCMYLPFIDPILQLYNLLSNPYVTIHNNLFQDIYSIVEFWLQASPHGRSASIVTCLLGTQAPIQRHLSQASCKQGMGCHFHHATAQSVGSRVGFEPMRDSLHEPKGSALDDQMICPIIVREGPCLYLVHYSVLASFYIINYSLNRLQALLQAK